MPSRIKIFYLDGLIGAALCRTFGACALLREVSLRLQGWRCICRRGFMPRFWGFRACASLREVNSRLQGRRCICRRGFMPRYWGLCFIAPGKLATTGLVLCL